MGQPEGYNPQPPRKKSSTGILVGLGVIAVLLAVIVVGGVGYAVLNDSSADSVAERHDSGGQGDGGAPAGSSPEPEGPTEASLRTGAPQTVEGFGKLLADGHDEPSEFVDYVCEEDRGLDSFADFLTDSVGDGNSLDGVTLVVDSAKVRDTSGEVSGRYVVSYGGESEDRDADEFIPYFAYEDNTWKLCTSAAEDFPESNGRSGDSEDSSGGDSSSGGSSSDTRPV